MISSYSIRTINITNMFRAKTALVTVLVLLSCVSMQAQKADVFGTKSKSMCLGVDIL